MNKKINVINDLAALIAPMYNFINDEDRLEENIVTLQTEKALDVYNAKQEGNAATAEYYNMIDRKIDKCNDRLSMHTIDACFPDYGPEDKKMIATMCYFYHGKSFLSDGMGQFEKCAGEILLEALSQTPIGKMTINYDVIVYLDRMSQYILKNYVSVKETESDIIFDYKDIKGDLDKIITGSRCQKITFTEYTETANTKYLRDGTYQVEGGIYIVVDNNKNHPHVLINIPDHQGSELVITGACCQSNRISSCEVNIEKPNGDITDVFYTERDDDTKNMCCYTYERGTRDEDYDHSYILDCGERNN